METSWSKSKRREKIMTKLLKKFTRGKSFILYQPLRQSLSTKMFSRATCGAKMTKTWELDSCLKVIRMKQMLLRCCVLDGSVILKNCMEISCLLMELGNSLKLIGNSCLRSLATSNEGCLLTGVTSTSLLVRIQKIILSFAFLQAP